MSVMAASNPYEERPLNVLFIVPYVPSRIRVRPYHLLLGLAERGHRVTLLCPVRGSEALRDLELLRPYCARIIPVQQGRLSPLLACARAIPTATPLQAAFGGTPELLRATRSALAEGAFDIVHVEHIRGAELARTALAAGSVPLVFDSVDSISLLFERTLRLNPSLKPRAVALLDLARTRQYEAAYSERFQRTLVTSPEDRWALQTLSRQTTRAGVVDVVPNGVDLSYFTPWEGEREPATLVLSGKMGYHANQAAALHLVQEIMPLVWRERPDVQVQLVGAQPPRAIRELAADRRVTVTGFVPDLRPYLQRATIAVCPLRYGVGIQNKALEAMASGTPVIAARQAAVALQAVPGQDLFLADDAHDFASMIVTLLASPALRATSGANGRAYVEQYHSWGRAIDLLEQSYRATIDTALEVARR